MPSLPYDINPADTLFEVEADPEATLGSDYLYILGRQRAYVVDRANLGVGQYFKATEAGFGNGPAGDAQFLLSDPGGAGSREFWSLAMQQARYVFRVTDFTQSGGGPLEFPDASEGYHSAGPTDGAVANFLWEVAFCPTFGGVALYDLSGSVPVPTAYQPAYDASQPAGDQDFTTEHLELVNFGTVPSPDYHLIAPTAEGSFFEWPIDPVSHEPQVGHLRKPGSTYWSAVSGVYGNDIVATTHPSTGQKWVFIDYSNANTGKFGLGRHNWTTNTWGPGTALTWTDPTPGTAPDITPNCRDLAYDGSKWIFMAGNGGFLVVNPFTWQVTDHVYTDNVGPLSLSFSEVMGIEASGNRVFASLADDANRLAIAMYAFNNVLGRVEDLQGNQTDLPVQALFDGAGGTTDSFPGIFIKGGERMSLVQLQANPKKLRLYSGTGNGYVLEIGWDQTTDAMTPLSTWHNGGYFDHIADCNVYMIPTVPPAGMSSFAGGAVPDFTLRIVVAKTLETFEIVKPPDMQ